MRMFPAMATETPITVRLSSSGKLDFRTISWQWIVHGGLETEPCSGGEERRLARVRPTDRTRPWSS
jgi:hypothetical protein